MDQVRAHCNNCIGERQHNIRSRVELAGRDSGYEDEAQCEVRREYCVLECNGCGDAHLVEHVWYGDDTEACQRFPPKRTHSTPAWLTEYAFSPFAEPSCRNPREIRRLEAVRGIVSLLNETNLAIANACHRLAAMGIRSVIDLVGAERYGDISLKQKVDQLNSDGLISRENTKHLDAAIQLGHAAVHRAFSPTLHDVESALSITCNLLEAIYRIPGQARSLTERTPKRRRTRRRKPGQ